MNALTTPKGFIARSKVHKVLKSSCTQCRWPKQRIFLKLNPKLFSILVVITLHQAWPSFFLSMPCILEEPWALKSRGDNSNNTSPSKTIGKNGLLEQISCHNPNFATHWSSVLEVPLNASKKPLIEYFQKRMKVVMTRQKTVMTMEVWL